MNKPRSVVLVAVLMIASLCAFREWQIHGDATSRMGIGPDVIVGDIPSVLRWGSSGGETSFSIGTTSCNIGDTRLDWISNSTIHPVISQNLFRVKDGRIEQIGMSWLKHGFAVAAGSHCGTCTDPAGNYLGVGCSDPYGASLNGSHSRLGPKSEVNATNGVFLWPHADLPSTGVLDGRIRVTNSDIAPASNPGARYFVESQYVHPQDAAAGNSHNNGSYREVFNSTTGGGGVDIDTGGPGTVQQQPAIVAWQEVHADVELFYLDVPGDGRIVVGMRTVEDKSGFHTEIAIENLTSHQSVESLTLKFPTSGISNPGFNDVDYQHEAYSHDDWTPTIAGNELEWATDSFATNPNANALRWNTLYSYWCDADSCPTKITLGLFRPGMESEVSIDLSEPVLPEGRKLLDGIVNGGQLSDVFSSNDQYYDLDPSPTTNPFKQKVDMIVLSTSPTSNPAAMSIRMEAIMNGGPSGDVMQAVELFNHTTKVFELVDMRPAETTESALELPVTGDLTRFVHQTTNEVIARVIWNSDSFGKGGPFTWNILIDEFIELIVD